MCTKIPQRLACRQFSAALCRGLIEAANASSSFDRSAPGFPRLYAAASLKLHRAASAFPLPCRFSAALCRGLIEATVSTCTAGAGSSPHMMRSMMTAACFRALSAEWSPCSPSVTRFGPVEPLDCTTQVLRPVAWTRTPKPARCRSRNTVSFSPTVRASTGGGPPRSQGRNDEGSHAGTSMTRRHSRERGDPSKTNALM